MKYIYLLICIISLLTLNKSDNIVECGKYVNYTNLTEICKTHLNNYQIYDENIIIKKIINIIFDSIQFYFLCKILYFIYNN
jgi:hypothetical protein